LCSYLLKSYPNTFLGSDLCSWLVSDSAGELRVSDRQQALACGMAMFHFKVTPCFPRTFCILLNACAQVAHHVVDEHSFQDTDKYFYRFYSDENSIIGASGSSAIDVDKSLQSLVSAALSFPTEYSVVVQTGSQKSSGTDSRVYVRLVGDGGDSGEFELAESEHFNKFETGQSDTFAFRSNVPLKNVQEVHVRIVVDSLIKRSWHLEAIEVRGGDLEEPIRFVHDQVISPDNPTAVLMKKNSADSASEPQHVKRSLSGKALSKPKGARFSKELAFGPEFQRISSSINETPVCFTFSASLNILHVGQSVISDAVFISLCLTCSARFQQRCNH
jgi:hypothetical protein